MIKSLLLCVTFFYSVTSMAAGITAKIVFLKRPAFSAVAYIADGKDAAGQTVDQKEKQFTQKLFVSPSQEQIVFKNSDSMDHNIYANSPGEGVKFDVGLVTPGAQAKLDTSAWKEGALIRVGCKIHPKMKSYIAKIASSNSQIVTFTKGQKEYSLTFDNLEGTQPFVLQMPGYDTINVDLAPGDTKTVELIRKKKVKGSLELSYQ